MTSRQFKIGFSAVGALVLATACGVRQTPQSFRLLPAQQDFTLDSQRQQFQAAREINTKVDILWVIDNSASMEPSQQKLRDGFRSFAAKYMRPGWDIRSAVITTDTYLADPAFAPYLKSSVEGSRGYHSKYTGQTYAAGVTQNELVPVWGPSYAKLLPGVHDGPIPAMCFELHKQFFPTQTRCSVREKSGNQGPDACLQATGDAQIKQCVNTVANNSIHSGQAILSTMPPAGMAADAAWTKRLADDFIVNLSVGASGLGSERGFQSVLQLIKDNEGGATALFRKGAMHMIVFVGDEDDQSLSDDAQATQKSPFQGSLENCARSVGRYDYRLQSCMDPKLLMPVRDVKERLDGFFERLDGRAGTYRVAVIVAREEDSLRKFHARMKEWKFDPAQDIGRRYLELADLVSKDSPKLDIGQGDYTPILNQIGAVVVQQVTTFTLDEKPARPEQVHVKLVRADGGVIELKPTQFRVEGRTLTVTDPAIVARMTAADRVLIEEQAQTSFRLDREPSRKEYVTVRVRRADGRITEVRPEQFTIAGRTLTLTDAALIRSLGARDRVDIRYEPKTPY
jgi:hypothetical protein